jgi:hypothetical protein
VTMTSVLFQPFASGAGDAVAVATGAVLSIFTAGEVNVAELPAASVTVTVPFTLEPSVLNVNEPGPAGETTPDRLSAVVKPIVTLVLFHPAAFGTGLGTPNVATGAVLSIFTAGDVTVAELPAASVTVTVLVKFEPSVVNVNVPGLEGETTPDKLSVTLKPI